MGTLDQVTQMKNQGIPENEIVNKLQEQGMSPKAINDALGQSKIKDAVSRPVLGEEMESSVVGGGAQPVGNSARAQEAGGVPNDEFYIPQEKPNYPRGYPSTQEYQEPANQQYQSQETSQANQEQSYQEQVNQPYQEQHQDYYGGGDYGGQEGYNEEYYPQEGYGQDYYGGGGGTDTMIEIAEQVFSEKIKKIQKQLEDLNEFKTLAETKLTYATNRLKRIEETIDKLQMAILEKVGSYGRGLDSIKKEMSMMQDSFSKTLPTLAHRQTHHPTTTHKRAVAKKATVKKTVSRKKR